MIEGVGAAAASRAHDFRLDGKAIVITGAGRGIGEAIAHSCASAGAAVYLGSRTITELESAAEVIRRSGGEAATGWVDVRDPEAIDDFIAGAWERFGRIDALVNNAGVNTVKPAIELSREEFDAIAEVNYRGTYFAAQSVGRRMIEAGVEGTVINMSSQVGLVGGPLRAAYSGSKGAVCQLTKSLAAEWAPHRITVNAVAPTTTATAMSTEGMRSEEFRRMNLENILLGRLARPEEVAGAVVYLASSSARMVTGHTLVIDGGWTAV